MAAIHRKYCSPEDGTSSLFGILELGCQDKFILPLILSTVPPIVMLLCMPFRLNTLFSTTVKTLPNYMKTLKIASLKIYQNTVLLY